MTQTTVCVISFCNSFCVCKKRIIRILRNIFSLKIKNIASWNVLKFFWYSLNMCRWYPVGVMGFFLSYESKRSGGVALTGNLRYSSNSHHHAMLRITPYKSPFVFLQTVITRYIWKVWTFNSFNCGEMYFSPSLRIWYVKHIS